MSQLNSNKKNSSALMHYRRLLLICLALIVVTIGGFGIVVYLSINSFQKSPVIYKEQLYSLKNGDNASTVLNAFITNPIEKQIDHMYLRFHKEYSAVQKGQYLVDGKKSLLDILKDMVAGNVVEKIYPTFTVVEGTNLSKILNNISKRKVDDKKFYSLIKDHKKFMQDVFSDQPELLDFIGGPKDNFEGFVAPATYPMYEKSPLYNLFKRGMINQVKLLKKEWENREPNDFVSTPYEALILASLIERETFLDEERSKVSSVFKNRLQNQMRLQTDPSVMYGVSRNFSGKLTKKHLKADTPYNTYTRTGLPPTPICMPQEKSIHAALHPEDSNSLYFVAKGVSPKEGHSFSSTLDEHNRAVKAYRKKVSEYLKQQKISDSSQDELIEAENEEQNKNSSIKRNSENKVKEDVKEKNNGENKDLKKASSETVRKKSEELNAEDSKTNDSKSSHNEQKTIVSQSKTAVNINDVKKQKSHKTESSMKVDAESPRTDSENNSKDLLQNSVNKKVSDKNTVTKKDGGKDDRMTKIRQIQKDAFKKESPTIAEKKKVEVIIRVD